MIGGDTVKYRIEFKFWARSCDSAQKKTEVRKFANFTEAFDFYKDLLEAFMGDQTVLGSISLYSFIDGKKKTFFSTTVY